LNGNVPVQSYELFLRMQEPEKLYIETGSKIKEAEESSMFGKPCFKIGGKAFIVFFQDCIVCKLAGDTHRVALALDGARLFDPSGKGRPMKEWVQVPFEYKKQWQQFATAACEYVKTGAKK
jgi:hypothetical protein